MISSTDERAVLFSGARVIELVPSIAPESFGLGYAALNLAAALARAGTDVFLASVDEERAAYEACEEARFPRERFVRGSLIGPARLRFAPSLSRHLSKYSNSGKKIVHAHGFWTYTSYLAGALSRRWKCPLVLSPHGELEPYALSISPGKKMLASLLYGRRNIKEASCMWALSEQEKHSIQNYGFTGQLAVIPNGVNRAISCSDEAVNEFCSKHNIAPGARVLLFLSRIARKKNLPLLLKAFAKNVQLQPEWVLLIAGSDERGHIHEVRALISELGIEKSVRLIGQVAGADKACAFTSASVFVLPSHSEGLPIAVLEAMEYAKPILLTDGWTLPAITCEKFGWRVPGEEKAFEAALLESMKTSKEILNEMGRSAQYAVREHFGWDGVAKQARSLYSTLIERAYVGKN